jgi:hypothetical protein
VKKIVNLHDFLAGIFLVKNDDVYTMDFVEKREDLPKQRIIACNENLEEGYKQFTEMMIANNYKYNIADNLWNVLYKEAELSAMGDDSSIFSDSIYQYMASNPDAIGLDEEVEDPDFVFRHFLPDELIEIADDYGLLEDTIWNYYVEESM